MNCSKCNTQIGEKDLVCPTCKKVLRLQCPVCGAITKNSVCEKCGSVIINKCYKCGKLNSSTLEKCPKCGLNVNASIGLRESVIEEFAVLTIEVTNFEDIKTAFKSDKIVEQFKKNLYTLIKKTAAQKKLRVQFLKDTFIIRFCKDYSFLESCKSALDFSIYVAQTVSEINKKLFDAKGVEIKVQMAVQKRDVYSKPSEYKSGLNINVVYSSSGRAHLFNNTEVVVDSYVYQEAKLEYPFQSLSAVYVKNQMVMFFELILHQIINLDKEIEEIDINNVKLPKNVDFEPEDEEEEKHLINFSSINCTFVKSRSENLLAEIAKVRAKEITNPVIAVRSSRKNGKLYLISSEEIQTIYEDYNVVRFSCPKNNKFNAYGLFKQMILAYKNLGELNMLLNPELIETLSQDSNIQDLFKMQIASNVHPEDLRYTYFESFTNFIAGIPYKTLFVIDDFENADEGSLEIIKYLTESKSLSNIGFIVSTDEQFQLHRKIYKLMTSSNYFEIEMKPSSNKIIVANHIKALKDIQDSFFLEKVLENTKGSHFYFNQALAYLVDDNVLEIKDNKYKIAQDRMIVIPKDLNELVQKRIQHLHTKENAFNLFGALLLSGERVLFSDIHRLGIKDDVKLLKYLAKADFISIVDDKEIVINNYNLYMENFLVICEKDTLHDISATVLEKIYINTPIANSVKARLLEFAKLKKEAFAQWHSLAMVSSQIGDFCAYLNCTNKFLSLVDNVIDAETDRTVEQVKMDVYAELASMLYKYYPDKILNFLQMLLTNLEMQDDDQKIKEVANKLVQSCLISGNYHNALEYIGKIISRTPRSSFNPNSGDFNLNYFLVNLVTLEIYFNLGRLNECIELGDELFRYVDLNTITDNVLPEGFSKKQFEDALLDAMFFVCASRVIQLKADAKDSIEQFEDKTSHNYSCFKLLKLMLDFFEGADIMENLKETAQKGLNDKYSVILFPILQGLISWHFQDWANFGNYLHNAKLQAAALQLHQMEYFCDLMIGFAYSNLGDRKKAKQIFYNVLDLSEQKGIKNIIFLSWVLIAKEEFEEGNAEMAVGIVNNSILNMENDINASDFFIVMFKSLSAEIMIRTNTNLEQALFCAEQAFETAMRSRLYIYTAQIADMLMFIYNRVMSTEQSKEVLDNVQRKIEHVQNTMSQFV